MIRDPIVGDDVHFVDGTACRAAKVTALDQHGDAGASLHLVVFLPDEGGDATAAPVRRVCGVEHDADRSPGSWHWPHRP